MKKEIARVLFCDEGVASEDTINACHLLEDSSCTCCIVDTIYSECIPEVYIRNCSLDRFIEWKLGVHNTSLIFDIRVDLQVNAFTEELLIDNEDGTYTYYLFEE